MKITQSWLREWVATDLSAAQIAEQLTQLGLEVDSVEPVAPGLEQVVVGRVVECAKHPNADRLSLCRVDVGQDDPLDIVCGAANVEAGTCYPVATIGARLPSGLEICRSKIRGEVSMGMLCSAMELGLADAADGIMALPAEATPGQPIVEALALDDSVIDIDLTPNRADCFSIIGIARDLAAGLAAPFEAPRVLPVLPIGDDKLPMHVDASEDCPRFLGRVVRDLDPDAETPNWMKERLLNAGVRPLHPVVDITNYVLLEYGQPMHAYDLQKISGGISVRRAGRDERLALLDGQTVNLDHDMLLIADASGPIGLAGIMGGASTAVGEGTQHIVLESAFFNPSVIAGRARRLGLHTDASMRFERGVDPGNQHRAIERATALVLEIAGGCPGPVAECVDTSWLPQPSTVTLRRQRLAKLLGVSIADDQVLDLLGRLDMQVESTAEGWRVTPPSARFDIAREVDLVEEVARLYGYDQIPAIPATAPVSLGRSSDSTVEMDRARLTLVERGYQEAITYSFVDPELATEFAGGEAGLRLSNPISAKLAVMRQSLWPGLIEALAYNRSRQHARIRLFEIGVRFILQDTELKEELVISGAVMGPRFPEHWSDAGAELDVYDVKADIEALLHWSGCADEFLFEPAEHPALRPGRAVQIWREGEAVGYLGELHPRLVKRVGLDSPPVVFELLSGPALAARRPKFSPVSKFPAVRRDLAVVVDENVPVGDLVASVRASAGHLLADLVVFDIYTGKKVENGSKSVALGLILQETSRTLTDDDVDGVMHEVTRRLNRDFDAAIRE